ncbi:putative pseudouridylate synthase 4 [Dioszegia hungarica]|uniref:tRNA pseudouridine(55) synthase n=1 Tax=Dioszegia hungarica TaxID=4972 RepID=A0AA38LTI3_9TREE|nr:putative pseudouridylate synthase 4 [Dioszegia hungarica]KAI9632536.1 putative pseudouridylate synthase 4 [Dioszegia hungarica]
MPKAPSAPPLPLNGLFPIAKPSGPSSMRCIDDITPLLLDSKLFYDPERIKPQEKRKRKQNLTHMGLKIGQGGTLDPLADGVLVIGVNRGTKHLNRFLECSKEYESEALLGAATTTYDSEGPVMSTHSFDNVTREDIERVLDQFRGKIKQTPPIFSALKMDGKPLYEYARESKPLPRAIPVRECTVSIDLIDFRPASTSPSDGGHSWVWPKERLSAEEKTVFKRLTDIVHQASASTGQSESDPAVFDLSAEEVPEVSAVTGKRPASFKVRMTVSSGTYVRSIVHDIGLALGCGAHVVTLTRTRQGEFPLYGDEEILDGSVKTEDKGKKGANSGVNELIIDAEPAPNPAPSGPSGGCIPWAVFQRALVERDEMLTRERNEREEAQLSQVEEAKLKEMFSDEAVMRRRRERDYLEWEVELLKRFQSVPVPIGGSGGVYRYK